MSELRVFPVVIRTPCAKAEQELTFIRVQINLSRCLKQLFELDSLSDKNIDFVAVFSHSAWLKQNFVAYLYCPRYRDSHPCNEEK